MIVQNKQDYQNAPQKLFVCQFKLRIEKNEQNKDTDVPVYLECQVLMKTNRQKSIIYPYAITYPVQNAVKTMEHCTLMDKINAPPINP